METSLSHPPFLEQARGQGAVRRSTHHLAGDQPGAAALGPCLHFRGQNSPGGDSLPEMETSPFQGTKRAGPRPAWPRAPSEGSGIGGKRPQKCPLFWAGNLDDSADSADPAAFGGNGGSCDGARRRFRRPGGGRAGARRRFRGGQKLLSLGPSEVPAAWWWLCRARRRLRGTWKLLSLGPSESPQCLETFVTGLVGVSTGRVAAVPGPVGISAVRGDFLSLGPSESPQAWWQPCRGSSEVPRCLETFVTGPVGGSALRGDNRAGAVGKSAVRGDSCL